MTKEEIIFRLACYGYEVVSAWVKDGANLLLSIEVHRSYDGIKYNGRMLFDINNPFVREHINEQIRMFERDLLNNIYYKMSQDLGFKINPDMTFRFMDGLAKHIDE